MSPAEAFHKLWNSLVDVEGYLRSGIAQQLRTAVSFSGDDMTPVHNAFDVFRRVDPYINSSIRDSVSSLFEELKPGLNEFLEVLRVFVSNPVSDVEWRKSAEKKATDVLNRTLDSYRVSMRVVAESYNTVLNSPMPRNLDTFDAFISHATEDKDSLVKPLAEALIQAGFKIWYDEFMLTVGDSLRRSIDKGLVRSRFGIVVISRAFFAKNWTQHELDGLVAREMTGSKVILPIWHNVDKEQVMQFSPSLADKYALSSTRDPIDVLVRQLSKVFENA